MKKQVFVAGHRGMAGSAILRELEDRSDVDVLVRTRDELDLTNSGAVQSFFAANRIDEIYLAAAKVGGIQANNTYPADFIAENLRIELNVIQSAYSCGVQRLLFLGSSCIYPKYAQQPMTEAALLTGKLEPTNEPYAIAKIAGIKVCESFNRQYGTDYRSAMPTNLYGPGDNFHAENSHVIPALLRRFHSAKLANENVVTVWGTGLAKREFLHVQDLARASLHIMSLPRETYNGITEPMLSHLNVGTGVDCSIADLAATIKQVVGYDGKIEFDTSKPDGTPQKLLDISRLREVGWTPTIELREGLADAYVWFLRNADTARR